MINLLRRVEEILGIAFELESLVSHLLEIRITRREESLKTAPAIS